MTKIYDLENRLNSIKNALNRMGYHMEGIPYHPNVDRTINWWAAAYSEVDAITEEIENERSKQNP